MSLGRDNENHVWFRALPFSSNRKPFLFLYPFSPFQFNSVSFHSVLYVRELCAINFIWFLYFKLHFRIIYFLNSFHFYFYFSHYQFSSNCRIILRLTQINAAIAILWWFDLVVKFLLAHSGIKISKFFKIVI